ncbi:MAG: DNA polymerase III subunit delta' [Halanaerobiaceae bacterium]|nr:DNA polymerase III subunit delta' [Bacillota bacterium]NLJ84280.1 DNA polymerase III subunit delta' [Halanaerobiaceae bacterium]
MSFTKLLGQENAVRLLKDDLDSGRIHHAYLFTGITGVGKRTLALEFARALFCEKQEGEACGTCLSCRKIEHSNHPDLNSIAITEGDSIKIEQIRELQRGLAFRPYESKWKLYIIEDADRMTPEAANSLLKTLEEPPHYGIIILLAREAESLLPTIISRCHVIQLNPLSVDNIEKVLLEAGYGDDERTRLVAALAGGSPGEAMKLMGDEDFFAEREKLYGFLYKLPDLTEVDVFKFVDELLALMRNKEEFPAFNLILNWYRDIILFRMNALAALVNSDYTAQYSKISGRYTLEELISIIELVNNIKRYIDSNVKEDLALQVMFLKIRTKRVK